MEYKIFEKEGMRAYCDSKGIGPHYEKAKALLKLGYSSTVQLRKRQPATDNIRYFRINRKWRAWCYKEGNVLCVFHIDDHQ